MVLLSAGPDRQLPGLRLVPAGPGCPPRAGRDEGRSAHRPGGSPGPDEEARGACGADPAAGLRPVVRLRGRRVLSARGGAVAGPGEWEEGMSPWAREARRRPGRSTPEAVERVVGDELE